MSSCYMPAQSVSGLHFLAIDVSVALLGLELQCVLEGFLLLSCEKMLESHISILVLSSQAGHSLMITLRILFIYF